MGIKITMQSIPGTSTEFEVAEGLNLKAVMEQANRAYDDGEVRVNGVKAPATQEVKAGDRVTQAKPARGA